DMAYLKPDADFGRFNKILLIPLGVDNVEIKQPNTSSSINRHNQVWELTDEDKLKLQELFYEAMSKQLQEKGGYTLVTEPGEGILQVQARLLGIAPSAPKDDSRSRPIGRGAVYTEGAGAMSVGVVFANSQNGEILALMKDSRATNNNWGRNNSVSNLADVRQMFNSWALGIRKGLDKAHGK
ncbi:MAG: DUF3313 family protein, partial [Proteobacteria bacterium]|nr:DUF3313 family protein [Pseudomonadota bacterium]